MASGWRISKGNLAKIAAAVCVVAIAFVAVFSYRSCIPGLTFEDGRAFAATLEPDDSDSLGVAADSSFTLTLDQEVPLSAVRQAFAIEPEVGFSVKAAGQGGKVFSITPDHPLEPDQVYRLSLTLAGPTEPGYSWAYQVGGSLRVVTTLPGDRSTGVPVNTGIEIEFSHEGVKEPGSLFTITPFVPGTWERHRRTLVYVPSVPLEAGQVYTCSLKAGLGLTGSEKALAEDYTFSFETSGPTQSSPDFFFYMDNSDSEFPSGEVPFFTMSYYRYGQPGNDELPAVGVRVFRYRDADAYVAGLVERDGLPWWAYVTRQNWQPPVAGLEPVLDTAITPVTVQYQNYIVLPDTLAPGYYLVSFELEPYRSYAWLQVTDLSSYTLAATDETVLWFNDLVTGRPVANVDVRAAGDGPPLGSSQANGVARFDTPPEALGETGTSLAGGPATNMIPPYYMKAGAPDGSEAVISLAPGRNPYGGRALEPDDYWVYLFSDRPLYQPDDSVNFWGIVEPRDGGMPELPEVQVELRASWGLWDGPFGGSASSDATLISTQDAFMTRHVYSGRVTLPNLRPGYYHLDLVAEGVTLASKYFEVQTYTKPAYDVQLTADKKAVFAGDTVNFGVEAAFFEGTPVSELKFDYHMSTQGASLDGTLTTDTAGRAAVSLATRQGTDPLIFQRSDFISVSADLPESGFIYESDSVQVFTRDVYLQGRWDPGSGSSAGTIEAHLNQITLDALNAPDEGAGQSSNPSGGSGPGVPSFVGDPVAGRQIGGTVEEIRTEAQEVGQYYDFVDKVVRKVYDYKEVRVPVDAFNLTTGPDGSADWAFTPEADKRYCVRLESQDDAGRAVAREIYVYGGAFVYPGSDYHWYHLDDPQRDNSSYAVGETVKVAGYDRESPLPARDAGYLFYTARKGLQSVKVSGKPEFSLTFDEDYIPDIIIGGVYFDGRSYNSLSGYCATYDYTPRVLDVTVTTDQAEYQPGDRAVIGVEVKDAEGRPAAAEVNLCVVDEALFALSNQRVDLALSLYGRTIGSYILVSRGSHDRLLTPGDGAESGGEGGEGRSDFKDTALFVSLTTGIDGKGTAEVKLPDNLTSWRLTYQAYAPGVQAASGVVNIDVKLPFFVEMSTNETYLAGDDPTIQVRAYGAALGAGSAVDFAARLGKLQADGSYAFSDLEGTGGTAFQPSGISLGPLAAGDYKLTVSGSAGLPDGTVLEDTLTRQFSVTDTYLKLDKVDYYSVGEGLKVSAEPGELATLTFCDQERGKYLEMLWRLVGGGRRVDAKAAAVVARGLLVDYFGYEDQRLTTAPTPSDLLAFQLDSGGVALLPYADANLEITAKAAALGDQSGFDQAGLAAYLGQVYDSEADNRERFIIALYGLAALNEPVLNDLREVAAEADLSVKEELYTCLGLAELGDEETARAIFAEVLNTYGDRIGSQLRLNVSDDREETIAATSLAAVLEAQLKMADRLALLDYLLDNTPWEELNFFEMARFMLAAVPAAPSETVSFTIEPGTTRVELDPGETYTCLRTADDLAGLGFGGIRGNVGLCVTYRAPVDLDQTEVRQGEAALTRSYWVDGKKTLSLGQGALVKVTIDYHVGATAPEGPFQLVDFLPSGLKAVPRPYELGAKDPNLTCPVEVDGQKVTFNVYAGPTIDPKTGQPVTREYSGTVVYFARIVSPGSFTADPSVLIHVKSGAIFAEADKVSLVIE